jgi:hypothetical protein
MSAQRLVYLYVDNVQVGTLFTAWSLKRVLARLRSFHPNAQALEVTLERKEDSSDSSKPLENGRLYSS